MSKFKDLTGQRFGKLVVISRAYSKIRTKWRCRCDCGVEKDVYSINLLRCLSTSCGCNRSKSPSNFKDLTGQRFGRLLVKSRVGINNQGGVTWKCKCNCGQTKVISSTCLLNIGTKSCGCLSIEKTKKRNMKDLLGQRFGRLIVISQLPSKKYSVQWKCKCDCGMECVVSGAVLIRCDTTSCGCYNSDLVRMRGQMPDLISKRRASHQFTWAIKNGRISN